MGYVQQKVDPIKVGDRVCIENAGKHTGKIGNVLGIRQGTSRTGRTQTEYNVEGHGWFPVVFFCPDQDTIRQLAAIQRSKREKKRDGMFPNRSWGSTE